MNLSIQDVMLGIVIALLGFLFTTTKFIQLVIKLNPFAQAGMYYIIFFLMIFVLGKFGLIMIDVKFGNFEKAFSVLLFTIAFLLITSWHSCYFSADPTTACTQVATSDISLDTAFWWGYSKIIVPDTPVKLQVVRYMTYVITPLMLCIIGGLMLKKQPEIAPI